MTATLLVINAGSSSVKFSLYAKDGLAELAEGQVERIGLEPRFQARTQAGREERRDLPATTRQPEAFGVILDWLDQSDLDCQIAAVAHRVVHGGTRFHAPVCVTPDIHAELAALSPLAPLHQPHNLSLLAAASAALPDVPQIACFDTAFHADHAPLFQQFAIPEAWTARGVRRYGFHGLSYEWIAERLREDYPALHAGRVVVAHLGNGSSLCALAGGRSIDTTMGMTALDGLPMGTRSGAIDPGALLYLQEEHGLSAADLRRLLYHESGLLGLSGESSDMRCLLASDSPRAAFAIDYYALAVAKYTLHMAVSLGGLDALVFTAGIGTHASEVRRRVCERLAPLIQPTVLVIPTDEERMMARHALHILAENPA
ncbi:MAG TPA: acetate kinase [Gammaproteobacteria bacterium]|nr:acetate kinase [Gammaproteobacteria bacterium]